MLLLVADITTARLGLLWMRLTQHSGSDRLCGL